MINDKREKKIIYGDTFCYLEYNIDDILWPIDPESLLQTLRNK